MALYESVLLQESDRIGYDQALFFNRKNMLRLYDKGNGANFIGYDEEGKAHEIAKRSGDFYFITMKNRKFALGEKLQNGSFRICENDED